MAVVDPEYIEKLHAVGRIAALNPADYSFDDYFEPLRHFPLCWIDGKLQSVLVRFGANGLVYNIRYLTSDEVKSYSILWAPKGKGKVGSWDWYLPSMGVISKAVGNKHAYAISDEQFGTLTRRLFDLRPSVSAIHPRPPEVINAMANAEDWIVPGGGEWVAAILQQQGKPADWTVPDEGGIMWIETLAIINDAPHPDIAKKYIQ